MGSSESKANSTLNVREARAAARRKNVVEVVRALEADAGIDAILCNGADVESAVCLAATSAESEMIDTPAAEDSELEGSDDRVELHISRAAVQVQVKRRERCRKSVVAKSTFR